VYLGAFQSLNEQGSHRPGSATAATAAGTVLQLLCTVLQHMILLRLLLMLTKAVHPTCKLINNHCPERSKLICGVCHANHLGSCLCEPPVVVRSPRCNPHCNILRLVSTLHWFYKIRCQPHPALLQPVQSPMATLDKITSISGTATVHTVVQPTVTAPSTAAAAADHQHTTLPADGVVLAESAVYRTINKGLLSHTAGLVGFTGLVVHA
jgi:hypothetical protein